MKPFQMEFILLGLPETTNSLGRAHWAKKAKEARTWIQAVRLKVGIDGPVKPLKRATLTLTRHSSGCLDPDGLVSSFKHVIDGLVAAKVLENDKPKNIGFPVYLHAHANPGCGYITVKIKEVLAP